jgi:hypothetical protein
VVALPVYFSRELADEFLEQRGFHKPLFKAGQDRRLELLDADREVIGAGRPVSSGGAARPMQAGFRVVGATDAAFHKAG